MKSARRGPAQSRGAGRPSGQAMDACQHAAIAPFDFGSLHGGTSRETAAKNLAFRFDAKQLPLSMTPSGSAKFPREISVLRLRPGGLHPPAQQLRGPPSSWVVD